MSSWQTKASCHVSIFFCLSHAGSEGCVPPGHCWGTVWHQLPARTHTARSKVLPGGLRFLPCRNLMIPGAVQCICHTDHNAPAQTEVRKDSYLTPSKISAAELPVPEVTVAGQAHPAQAEDSHSCSRRQGQRISCPVKARSLCDTTRKRMKGSFQEAGEEGSSGELPWPWCRQPVLGGLRHTQILIPQGRAVSAHLRPVNPHRGCLLQSDKCVPSLTPSTPAHLAFEPEGQAPGQHNHEIVLQQKVSC